MKILTEFLAPDNIRERVMLSSKKRVLELVGKIVAESLSLQCVEQEEQEFCPIACFECLFKREKLGSTALGNGVALPHAKLLLQSEQHLDKPLAVFLQLEKPIDYETGDHKEVDLIYAMFFPEGSCEKYKDRLPQIAQALSDKTLIKQLRAATSREDLWQILHLADLQNSSQNRPLAEEALEEN